MIFFLGGGQRGGGKSQSLISEKFCRAVSILYQDGTLFQWLGMLVQYGTQTLYFHQCRYIVASGCMLIWVCRFHTHLGRFSLGTLIFSCDLKIGILPHLLIVRQSALIHSRSRSAVYSIPRMGNPPKKRQPELSQITVICSIQN